MSCGIIIVIRINNKNIDDVFNGELLILERIRQYQGCYFHEAQFRWTDGQWKFGRFATLQKIQHKISTARVLTIGRKLGSQSHIQFHWMLGCVRHATIEREYRADFNGVLRIQYFQAERFAFEWLKNENIIWDLFYLQLVHLPIAVADWFAVCPSRPDSTSRRCPVYPHY